MNRFNPSPSLPNFVRDDESGDYSWKASSFVPALHMNHGMVTPFVFAAGAIAQLTGHKLNATAEGYRPRSVDALRPYLAQIEAHILGQAGVKFDALAAHGALRVVA